MRTDHRWLVVFAGNVLFLFLIAQLNHHLTQFPLFGVARGQAYLFLVGLPVAFATLRLNLRAALVATIATALAFEAPLSLPPGTVVLPAGACVCLTMAFRANFNRFESSTAIFAALIVNVVMMLAVTLVTFRGGGVSLTRVAVDLLISQLALVMIAGWFFAAQTALLDLFGFHVDTELRESL